MSATLQPRHRFRILTWSSPLKEVDRNRGKTSPAHVFQSLFTSVCMPQCIHTYTHNIQQPWAKDLKLQASTHHYVRLAMYIHTHTHTHTYTRLHTSLHLHYHIEISLTALHHCAELCMIFTFFKKNLCLHSHFSF